MLLDIHSCVSFMCDGLSQREGTNRIDDGAVHEGNYINVHQ
jgi:hypothetical protein